MDISLTGIVHTGFGFSRSKISVGFRIGTLARETMTRQSKRKKESLVFITPPKNVLLAPVTHPRITRIRANKERFGCQFACFIIMGLSKQFIRSNKVNSIPGLLPFKAIDYYRSSYST